MIDLNAKTAQGFLEPARVAHQVAERLAQVDGRVRVWRLVAVLHIVPERRGPQPVAAVSAADWDPGKACIPPCTLLGTSPKPCALRRPAGRFRRFGCE